MFDLTFPLERSFLRTLRKQQDAQKGVRGERRLNQSKSYDLVFTES